jgi:hypothetical protein
MRAYGAEPTVPVAARCLVTAAAPGSFGDVDGVGAGLNGSVIPA